MLARVQHPPPGGTPPLRRRAVHRRAWRLGACICACTRIWTVHSHNQALPAGTVARRRAGEAERANCSEWIAGWAVVSVSQQCGVVEVAAGGSFRGGHEPHIVHGCVVEEQGVSDVGSHQWVGDAGEGCPPKGAAHHVLRRICGASQQ